MHDRNLAPATLFLLCTAPLAAAQGKDLLLGHEENWSSLADKPAEERTWAERLKWMPLDDAGDWRLDLGGSVRGRVEAFNAFGFGGAAPARTDDVYWLAHAFAHANLTHESGFRAYLELTSALVWDRELPGGTRVIDENQFEPFQAFVEQTIDVGEGAKLDVSVGRRTLLFGRQRLVSPLPWANAFRQFQGAYARYTDEDWKVDAFWTEFVPVDIDEFDEPNDDDFYGVHATRGSGPEKFDLYFFATDRASRTYNGTTGAEERFTVGGRKWRKPAPGTLDYDLEFAYQFGDIGDASIDAYMLAARVGHKYEGERAPRVEAFVELGSGDSRPGGNVGTFAPAFPLGHAYFGIADTLGRENAIDLGLAGYWTLADSTKAVVRLHQFLRYDTDDTVYNVAGAGIGATSGSDSRNIGQEIDLIVTHQANQHLQFQAGYAHVFVGNALDDVGLDEDLDFFYLQSRFSF